MQTWIALATLTVCAGHILRSTILGWLFSVPLLVIEGSLSIAGILFNTEALVPIQVGFLAAWVALLVLRRMLGGRRPC